MPYGGDDRNSLGASLPVPCVRRAQRERVDAVHANAQAKRLPCVFGWLESVAPCFSLKHMLWGMCAAKPCACCDSRCSPFLAGGALDAVPAARGEWGRMVYARAHA